MLNELFPFCCFTVRLEVIKERRTKVSRWKAWQVHVKVKQLVRLFYQRLQHWD
ncbi:hypothetical protein DPMN_183535 [Dreissena polymorpha]|uniref:Uncharacterized protein n=1 Tax=Dreissena polymorpha TaxID=45954 RepID=A0A9D4DIJ6_DREPO|nr:hypothetical protein DPMN_183535 [Dreissena polymorpha]